VLAIANAIAPLDTLGNPAANGRVTLISIGMSNGTQEFSTFVLLANADAQRDPHVLVIDCAQGGQATQDIRLPTAAYWDTVGTRLRGHGSSPLQAQVVWIKEARRQPTEPFPASAESLTNDLGRVVRIIHSKLPNVKLVYFTSRIYAGYATSALNPEPYAYESGFAEKWLIGAQIAGTDSLNFDPAAGPVRAPWLSWGPYLWADGETPRTDGLVWHCSDFQSSDGTHPSTSGREKVADSLLAFFHQESTAIPWYLRQTTAVPHTIGARLALSVAPNPAVDGIELAFVAPRGETWRLELLDVAGRSVAALGSGAGSGALETVRWNARRGRSGLYWARLVTSAGTIARRVVLIGR